MSVATPLSTASGRKTIINSRIVHAAPPLNQVGICHNFRWVPASAIAGPRRRHSKVTTTDPTKGCEESLGKRANNQLGTQNHHGKDQGHNDIRHSIFKAYSPGTQVLA